MKRARPQTTELPAASPEGEGGEGTELLEAVLAEHESQERAKQSAAQTQREKPARAEHKAKATRGAPKERPQEATREGPKERPKILGVITGVLVRVDGPGEAIIELPPERRGAKRIRRSARSTVKLTEVDAGREVTLMFDRGDPKKPIVMGLLQPTGSGDEAVVDGERVVLTAKREIVLRCGKASITLTRAGKVLIRGAYVSSRSTGTNRVKGGSVEIN